MRSIRLSLALLCFVATVAVAIGQIRVKTTKTVKKATTAKKHNCPKDCKCPCSNAAECNCNRGEFCDSKDCDCALVKKADNFGVEWDKVGKNPKITNFGVDRSKLHSEKRYTYKGKEISQAEAKAKLTPTSGTVPDDAKKLRLTVIGTPEQTAPVLRDLAQHGALAPYKTQLLVQAYEPNHWAVQRVGFVGQGTPTIYIQAPTGLVLHRQNDYRDGPTGLAEALRKLMPYDPTRDTDLRLRKTPIFNIPKSAGLLALAGAFLLLWPRRKP